MSIKKLTKNMEIKRILGVEQKYIKEIQALREALKVNQQKYIENLQRTVEICEKEVAKIKREIPMSEAIGNYPHCNNHILWKYDANVEGNTPPAKLVCDNCEKPVYFFISKSESLNFLNIFYSFSIKE